MRKVVKSQQSEPRRTAKAKHNARKPHPRKKSPSTTIEPTDLLTFPEVKGKTIAELKLCLRNDETAVSIFFADRTLLHFDLEPRVTIRTEFSDWKTHNQRSLKCWPPLTSETAWEDN